MNRLNPAWLLTATIAIAGLIAHHHAAAATPEQEADAAVLALLNSYEVGTTSYLTFSQDFDLSREAVTKSRIGERRPPTTGRIGIIDVSRGNRNLIFKGPDAARLAAEIMAAEDNGKPSAEINVHMLGTFLFGYTKVRAAKSLYSYMPADFAVVARLRFADGVLVEKAITMEPGNAP